MKDWNLRLRLLSYLVIFYMLLGFTWWIVLLLTKNNDAFLAKSEVLKIGMVAEGRVRTDAEFYKTKAYQDLKREYTIQEWMIVGEAIFLIISLGIGFWLINRGYNKEVRAGEQRRNFLLSITHELKSPIASIRLVLETLLKRQLSAAQFNQLSQSALKETERLNTLVNNLLLSAKLDFAYELHRTEIDMNQLLRELIAQFRTKYPDSTFTYQSNDSEIFFLGDHMGITSVIVNLLENAVKYSANHAEVTVVCNQYEKDLQILVKDQGVGISEKEKKRVFEKFYRVGNEDTRITKGTGLGLFIVNQIVKAHNGKVEVFDNQLKGTQFIITLPHVNAVLE